MATPYYDDGTITIWHADCRDVSVEGVRLIWTDPPYPREFDHVWDLLAEAAVSSLRPDGNLVTLLGHFQLPRVIHALSDVGLVYRWICTLRNTAQQPIMHGWNVKVMSKPALWFGMPTAPARALEVMRDDFTFRRGSFADARTMHKWGQGIILEPILALTNPGDLVFDPFAGTGSNLVGAKTCGRRAVGIDIDERSCEIAARRCAQGVLWEAV